jgi:hypothetical protein
MSSNRDREGPASPGDEAALARAWKQASDEQPPARLDAAILAAARRSVGKDVADPKAPPGRTRPWSRWMPWQPLAAAATVAALAFVLVQTLPREREVAPPIRIETTPPAPSAGREPTPPVHRDTPVGTALDVPAFPGGRQNALSTGESTEEMTEAAGEAVSAEAAAEAAAPDAARAPAAAAPRSDADWAARIEALHASGDLAGAAAALREFRAADPDADAQLPASLQEWARTVK